MNIVYGLISAGVILLALLARVIKLVKIKVTYRNLVLLHNALDNYNHDCIERGAREEIRLEYYNMFPDFDVILHRPFDWGYKNILPKEVFEKVEPFIKKRGKK